jgi:L-rhamnose mutarotase
MHNQGDKIMDTVKVQYTVKESYVETNKQNIKKVMDALREINNPDLKYSAFLQDDGKTFVHFVMRANEEAASALNNLEAFQQFQQALKASQPEVPPKPENLYLVASAWDIF